MKLFLITMMLAATSSIYAGVLSEDLKTKSCSIEFSKTVFVNESDEMTQLGRVMFAPILNERNLLLKKGSRYKITEADEEVIVINERENIVFLCIIDDTLECSKLSLIDSSDFSTLSDNSLKLICE